MSDSQDDPITANMIEWLRQNQWRWKDQKHGDVELFFVNGHVSGNVTIKNIALKPVVKAAA